ncbi:MAG: MATE family efflux transporter [Spirochaetaceae bacterium]|nr:MATE family efflux transporter [Spirochaetaceae bacterium]
MKRTVLQIGPLTFYREALSIALPVMLQQFIMSMVSLIDNFMVAGLGDSNMASVNVANQINFVYIVLVNTVCGAGGIYLAQFKGAGNHEGMRHAYRFKVIFALSASIVFFILCWTIPEIMIAIMTPGNNAQAEIISKGAQYLRFTSFTLVPIAISSSIGSSFREIGLPKIPLIISACATVINTIGNWILIYGNMGAPRMEIAGAAIATIIARVCELSFFLLYIHKRRTLFFVSFITIFKIDKRLIKEILAKSLMMFASELSWISSETVVTALLNGRGGAETVAGMSAGFTIANIFFLVFSGIWTASTVIIGGSLGAGKLEEARNRGEWIKSGAVILGIVVAVLGTAVSVALIPLVFSNLSDSARQISLGIVFVILVYLPLWALLNALFAISRAGGDTAMGMWADVSVNTILFLPGAFILAFTTSMGPVSMYAILKTSDIVKYLVARHFFKKERWIRNLTLRINE